MTSQSLPQMGAFMIKRPLLNIPPTGTCSNSSLCGDLWPGHLNESFVLNDGALVGSQDLLIPDSRVARVLPVYSLIPLSLTQLEHAHSSVQLMRRRHEAVVPHLHRHVLVDHAACIQAYRAEQLLQPTAARYHGPAAFVVITVEPSTKDRDLFEAGLLFVASGTDDYDFQVYTPKSVIPSVAVAAEPFGKFGG